jgi:hypothetical protein
MQLYCYLIKVYELTYYTCFPSIFSILFEYYTHFLYVSKVIGNGRHLKFFSGSFGRFY